MLSYASGPSSLPLLGETIGENLRRTVERHGDSDALVVPHQEYRATYRQLWDETSLVARGLIARGVKRGDRVGIWSPNRFEWVIIAVRHGAHRRDPRQHQPGLQDQRSWRTCSNSPACRSSSSRGHFDRRTTCACSPRCGIVPGAARGAGARRRMGRAASRRTSAPGRRARSGRSRRCSSTTRSTSSTRPAPPASPRARRCRTTTSSTTGSSSARRSGTPLRIACASPCRSITASAWSSATSRARRTAPASSFPERRSTRTPSLRITEQERARRSTACRPCSSPSSSIPGSSGTI